jgi:polygalacturonase
VVSPAGAVLAVRLRCQIASSIKDAEGTSVVFSIDNYGARGDAKHDVTPALAKAWNMACSSSRPAVLLVPKGKSYLLKTLTLAGPCKSTVDFAVKGTVVAPHSRSFLDKSQTCPTLN